MRYRKPLPSDIGRMIQFSSDGETWEQDTLLEYHWTLLEGATCFVGHMWRMVNLCRIPFETNAEDAQLCEAADWFAERGQDATADWLMKIADASDRVRQLALDLLRETQPCTSWNRQEEMSGRVRYSATFGSSPEFRVMANFAPQMTVPMSAMIDANWDTGNGETAIDSINRATEYILRNAGRDVVSNSLVARCELCNKHDGTLRLVTQGDRSSLLCEECFP